MFCNQYKDAILELADGTLGPVRRAELQTHLDTCDGCRALAADLQKIRSAASTLDSMMPPARVWQSIAAQLRQEGRVVSAPLSRTRSLAALAIAASLLLAVGGSLYLLRSYDRTASTTGASAKASSANQAGNAQTQDPVQSITDELSAAVQHYESAIVKLEQVVNSKESPIDPQTAEILKKNLPVMNQVIAETKSALQAEPQNVPARQSLFEALRMKVNLLQNTIALMNHMRKGNSAGAAQLVDPGSKS